MGTLNPQSPQTPPSPPPTPPYPSVYWSFEKSYGSTESVIATHDSPIPTYSWEKTDSISIVIPETQFSVNPSCSPLPPLSPSADLSFNSTVEPVDLGSDVDPFPIYGVVPETPLTTPKARYTEEEERYIRFIRYVVIVLPWWCFWFDGVVVLWCCELVDGIVDGGVLGWWCCGFFVLWVAGVIDLVIAYLLLHYIVLQYLM
ncbi:hypothetical protein SASPL_124055 [Salvia splendens]|uniref:Uncharacterized protein n=1 Tax=Salvia splendens TaxID=180675 RepID=A0A8X8ZTK8_SALSN|nr:hypothetical protein SASPL_124055 [Salvia splendens]